MTDTVFYAWQSDLPNNTNRAFIRAAIDKAIEITHMTMGVEEAIRADQDTQGVTGDVHVAEIIFDKIRKARIFVADITTITSPGSARPCPNPNVLIEYGRASIAPGSSCVVTVFNEAFGAWQTERPFDMRHRRKPVTYRLAASNSPEERSTALEALAIALAEIFSEVLRTQGPAVAMPTLASFEPLRSFYKTTLPRDRQTGRIIGFWCGAIPCGSSLAVRAPWDDDRLVHRMRSFPVKLGTTSLRFEVMDGANHEGPFTFTPIHNGAVGRWDRRFESNTHERKLFVEDISAVYIQTDGKVAIATRSTELAPEPHLNIRWIMADVMNALLTIERVRRAAGQPAAPYALLLELRYDEQESPDIVNPVDAGNWRLADLSDESGRIGKILTSAPKTFGPFRVGARSSFPELLQEIFVQVETSAQRRPNRDISFAEALDGVA